MKINKKIVIFSISVLLCLGAFLLLYNYPKTIDVEYPAVEAHINNPASMQKTTIKIKGTLYRPLFNDRSFKGQLSIEKYDYTRECNSIDISFGNNGWGNLQYTNIADGQISLKTLGYICMTNDFDKLKILVGNTLIDNNAQPTDLTICAPAQTFDEALSISKSLPEVRK